MLVLHGPTHLRSDEGRVPLRTKGLALLCILALDGPSRRERIADLLWAHGDAANNLRVELHRLRQSLASIGVHGLPAGRDPLELPTEIEADRTSRPGSGQPLEGLDDLSEHFQAWVEMHRNLLALERAPHRVQLRQRLLDDVARHVVQPYLLVLKGSPGSGRHEFAKALAGRLGLQVVETVQAAAPALHFLEAREVDAEQVAHHVLRQTTGVWALTESAFDRESALLLLMRKLYPPERMRFIELDGVSWHEARSHLLSGLTFEEAARLYLTTGGHIGYMRELLHMRPQEGFGPDSPVPQRIRAAFLLETRRLPDSTRAVLEQLSVHPGALPDLLLTKLGFTQHLDALEESGWLRFDGSWSYRDEVSRKVVYKSLQAGRRAHYHARLAAALAEVESETGPAATYHSVMAARSTASNGLPSQPATAPKMSRRSDAVRGFAALPPRVSLAFGRELALLLERHTELHVGEGEEWCYWVRDARDTGPSFAFFTLPDEPCLIHIEVRWFDESPCGVDDAGETYPLRLRFRGGPRPERQVDFLDTASAASATAEALLLREGSARFSCDHRTLLVESHLEPGIVEFRLRAYQVRHEPATAAETFDLVAPSTTNPLAR